MHFSEVSGHVFRREGKRSGPVWYAKYRLPHERQVQRKIGPAWTERGRPASGFFTKQTAEAWLRDVQDQARAGTLPGMVRTNATVADACFEWLRYSAEERGCSPGTMRGRRSEVRAHFLPAFGDLPLESVTIRDIERWRSSLPDRLSVRTKNKLLTELGGIFKRANRSGTFRSIPSSTSSRSASARAWTSRSTGRGGAGVGPLRRLRAGRRDLPHRRLHGSAARRADRPALA